MADSEIIIFSDGACLGNPGPGGYAAILSWKNRKKEISGGYRMTTNNRMEMMALIFASKAVSTKKLYKIKVYTDSKLITDAYNLDWITKWRANGWKRNKKEFVLNPDLWMELAKLTDIHNVQFNWVKGHDGIPENERCDFLSKQAAASDNLAIDVGYERPDDFKLFI